MNTNQIDPELLKLIACPSCDERPPVAQHGSYLVCTICGLRYPIEDGIPHMLVEEALPALEAE